MSACHSTRSCSPLKTVLGKIGDRYQANCTTYKYTLWLPSIEMQAVPWTEVWMFLQRTQGHADIDNVR